MTALLLRPTQNWECPNCTFTDVTHIPTVAPGQSMQHFHLCAGLKGVLAPMVGAGLARKVKVHAIEREDYVGAEQGLRYDGDGMAVMAVETVRDDGTDRAVFAGCAYGDATEER